MKPLLDGVVGALHCSDATHATTLERVAARTGWDPGAIAQRLRSPPAPVLGERRGLVASYRDFVKWNPADELCDRCTLVVEPKGPGPAAFKLAALGQKCPELPQLTAAHRFSRTSRRRVADGVTAR